MEVGESAKIGQPTNQLPCDMYTSRELLSVLWQPRKVSNRGANIGGAYPEGIWEFVEYLIEG